MSKVIKFLGSLHGVAETSVMDGGQRTPAVTDIKT